MLSAITKILKRKYYGFLACNHKLSQEEINTLEALLHSKSGCFTTIYEQELSKYLGGGNVKTFASGRMAFYSLLNAMGVSKDDEVVLTGYTCSVMVNAVFRTGAKAVFADIDKDTFGMDPAKLKTVINERTKVVVAQHSFGIPCEIDKISAICQEAGVFLIEDCALSLGSKYKGVVLGNFGDAAIFSTDHSKPLNTLIGGFLYTNTSTLFDKLSVIWDQCPELSTEHRSSILKRLLWERKCYSPFRYKYLMLSGYMNRIKKRFSSVINPFLENDYSPLSRLQQGYNYPSKLPEFLAYLGILELKSYADNGLKKCDELYTFIAKMSNEEVEFPNAYFNKECQIIPLRIIFRTPKKIFSEMSMFLDVNWIWFREPIVCTKLPLIEYGYVEGTCITSEKVCEDIFNIPITMNDSFLTQFLLHVLEHN
uniref:DegT/DnrJ/EryC1/StrS family aminotransferase n=1 Tax=uncultured Bacteroides sp. TaxID=162156 RepID=UPI00280BF648|nr:DegT/DnrJ/EryC1/StrS family aminotransferase [uncultured Bacteroides sp.]